MAQVEEFREFTTFAGTRVSLDQSGKPLEPIRETEPRRPVYKPRRPKLSREQFLRELNGGRRTAATGKPMDRTTFLKELKNG